MPRVSEEHLEQRRRQILDAAAVCFTRQGFHQTSMQDIFKQAGLSAGAVYRYFPSKAEIVREIAHRSRGVILGYLEEVAARPELPPLGEIVAGFAACIEAELLPGGELGISPQVWAAAVYDEEIGAIVRDVLGTTRAGWAEVARRLQAAGRLPADASPEAVGATLVCLVPGFVLQKLILKDVEPATLGAGVDALFG